MQTIRINGKEMKVSAGEERILRTLARSDFIAGKDNFVEGPATTREIFCSTLIWRLSVFGRC
jgi:hypothetical protein